MATSPGTPVGCMPAIRIERPTQMIRKPNRLLGRRLQASSPAATYSQPTSTLSTNAQSRYGEAAATSTIKIVPSSKAVTPSWINASLSGRGVEDDQAGATLTTAVCRPSCWRYDTGRP